MGVTDAVDDVPAFGNLVTLMEERENQLADSLRHAFSYLSAISHLQILRCLLTYIEFKGLKGHPEASWNRRVDPQSLFNDTAGIFQLLQRLNVETLEVHPLLLLKPDKNSK